MFERLVRLHHPAVGLPDREVDDSSILSAPALVQHVPAHFDDSGQLAFGGQLFQLPELGLALGKRRGDFRVEEELHRLVRLAGDLLQGLHRRSRPAFFDEVDGGSGELAPGHLGQRQPGFTSGLLDRTRTDGDTFAATAVSAAEHGRECMPCPAVGCLFNDYDFTGSGRSFRRTPGRPSTPKP